MYKTLIINKHKNNNLEKLFFDKSLSIFKFDITNYYYRVNNLIKNACYELIVIIVDIHCNEDLIAIKKLKQKTSIPVFICLNDFDVKYILLIIDLGIDEYYYPGIYWHDIGIKMLHCIRRYSQYGLINIGQYSFTESPPMIYCNRQSTDLAPIAAKTFIYLLKNKNVCVTREEIYRYIYGCEYGHDSRTIDTHICAIRTTFNDGNLKTVRGQGYMYSIDAEAA